MTDPLGDPLPTVAPLVDQVDLADLVATAVRAVPGVVALHGGTFGDVVTYLPGRKLAGVRIGRADEPVEVAVVLGLTRPIPDVVAAVRRAVATVCGDRTLDVTVADVTEEPAPVAVAVVIDGPGPAPRRTVL